LVQYSRFALQPNRTRFGHSFFQSARSQVAAEAKTRPAADERRSAPIENKRFNRINRERKIVFRNVHLEGKLEPLAEVYDA
jgi:hypothetical protein